MGINDDLTDAQNERDRYKHNSMFWISREIQRSRVLQVMLDQRRAESPVDTGRVLVMQELMLEIENVIEDKKRELIRGIEMRNREISELEKIFEEYRIELLRIKRRLYEITGNPQYGIELEDGPVI